MNNIAIVQFSTRNPEWELKAYGGKEEDRKNWFFFRCEIFKKCLWQCLDHQSSPLAKIYLLLDQNDTDWFDQAFDHSNLSPMYAKNIHEFMAKILVDLQKNNLHRNSVIAKIDSDDMICRDYFLNLGKQLEEHPKRLIVAPKGFRSDLIKIQSAFYSVAALVTQFNRALNNPNFDRLDRSKEISIFNFNHIDIWKMDHHQCHAAEWIQLVHGTNQHNAFEPPTNFKDDKVDMYSSSYTPAIGIDPVWFEKWAGFSMPDPSVLYFPKLY